MTNRRLRLTRLLPLLLLLAACRKTAPSLQILDLSYMPADVIFVTGVDLSRLRDAPLYGDWHRGASKEGSRWGEVERFLVRVGVDPNKDLVGFMVGYRQDKEAGEWLAVLRGHFDVARIEKGLQEPTARMSVEAYRQRTLYNLVEVPEVGELSLAVLDPEAIGLGRSSTLRQVLDVIDHKAPSLAGGKTIPGLVAAMEPAAQICAALDGRELARLVSERSVGMPPGVGEPALRNLSSVVSARMSAQVDADIALRLEVGSRDQKSARNLADALKGVVGFARMGTGERDPDMAKILDSVRVDGEGSAVKIRIDLPGDSLRRLEARMGKEGGGPAKPSR